MIILLWSLVVTHVFAWAPEKPTVEKFQNGLEVHWYRKQGHPLTEIAWTLESGATNDPAGKSGTSETVCMLLARKVSLKVEAFGGRAYCHADADDIEIRVEGFSKDAVALLGELTQTLQKPEFVASETDWVRQQKVESFLHRADQPQSLVAIHLQRLLWKGTSYEHAFEAQMQDVQTLGVADIQAWYLQNFNLQRSRLWLVSALDVVSLRPLLKDLKSPLKADVGAGAPFLKQKDLEVLKPIQVIDRKGLSQAWFQMAVRFPVVDRAVLSVLNSVLGDSFRSRLTTALRDETGTVYQIGSRIAHVKAGSQWVIEGSAPAALAGTVQKEIQKILVELNQKLPTETEIVAAKEYLKGKYALGFSSPSDIAEYYVAEGQEGDLGQGFEKVTKAQVQSFLKNEVLSKSWITVWAGDGAVILDSLKQKSFKSVKKVSPLEVVKSASIKPSTVKPSTVKTSPQKGRQKKSRSLEK